MPYRAVTPTPPAPRHESELGLRLLTGLLFAASPILFPAWILHDAWQRLCVSLLPLPRPSIEPLLTRLAVERPTSVVEYVWFPGGLAIASGPEEEKHVVVVRFAPSRGRRGDRFVVRGHFHTRAIDPASVVTGQLFQRKVDRIERRIQPPWVGLLFAVPATFVATAVLAIALGKPALWLLAVSPICIALSSLAYRCEARWWKRAGN